MPKSKPIVYWNRQQEVEEVEKVYGDFWLNWVYGTKPGQKLADTVFSQPFLSKLYGLYQSSVLSSRKIPDFIENFQIPMQEYEGAPFKSFNDFFIRKFKMGQRPFTAVPAELPAFSEARYLGYESVDSSQIFPVKGKWLSAESLISQSTLSACFRGGPLLLARLCPTDYHRFHFPDAGTVLEEFTIAGKLHSVNPVALQYRNEIFATNERHVSILQTENFGKLAYVEVGALCVGKIVQTYSLGESQGSSQLARFTSFKRGDEKGYFLFGGSTVMVFGEPGRWKPDQDILDQTAKKRETLVRLGERVASAK